MSKWPEYLGNENDQSQPKQVYADPIDWFITLRQDYVGSDDIQLRPTQRVVHPTYGIGTVKSLIGGSLLSIQNAVVNFDSGKIQNLPCREFAHVQAS
jgi:hypothetical protein